MKKFAYLVFVVFLAIQVKAQSVRGLFKADLSRGLSQFPSLEVPNNRALIISDSVKRYGQKSVRSEVFSGSPDIKSIRSEIAFKPSTEDEEWCGVSIFAPESYLPDPEPEIVTQWHDTPDFRLGENWISPSLSLRVQNGRWNFDIRWDTSRVTAQGKWMGYLIKDLGAVKLNSWTDWVFHIKFSYKADGLVEVYRNGVKVYTHNGPNGYNDQIHPYWKVGIYKWVYKNHDVASHKYNHRLLYYSQIKMAGKDGTYEDVAPEK